MQTSWIAVVLASGTLAASGCGGVTDTGGGGGSEDGGDAAAPSDGGGSTQDGASHADAGVDCNALGNQVVALQAKAQSCCPNCNIVQCYSAVAGTCCDVSVTSPTSAATTAFEAAVAQYEASCPFECPDLACPTAPSGICGMSGECQ